MLQYYKQEMRDLRDPESGRVREVYKVLLDQSVTAEEFQTYMTNHCPMTAGEIAEACVNIARFLGELLAKKGSVTLPGVGTFSVGISMKKNKGFLDKRVTMTATGMPLNTGSPDEAVKDKEVGEEDHNTNARSIEVSHINFRCGKELLKDVQKRLSSPGSLQRSKYYGYVPLARPVITRRLERFAAAREYLADHPYMRITDYVELTGLSYTTAQRELKLADELTHSGLVASGSGSHRVYVLRK